MLVNDFVDCLALCTVTSANFFFFNDTATTEIYTLSLHDALPISRMATVLEHCDMVAAVLSGITEPRKVPRSVCAMGHKWLRSEEHTSELQSQSKLVCRLLLEKKNNH